MEMKVLYLLTSFMLLGESVRSNQSLDFPTIPSSDKNILISCLKGRGHLDLSRLLITPTETNDFSDKILQCTLTELEINELGSELFRCILNKNPIHSQMHSLGKHKTFLNRSFLVDNMWYCNVSHIHEAEHSKNSEEVARCVCPITRNTASGRDKYVVAGVKTVNSSQLGQQAARSSETSFEEQRTKSTTRTPNMPSEDRSNFETKIILLSVPVFILIITLATFEATSFRHSERDKPNTLVYFIRKQRAPGR